MSNEKCVGKMYLEKNYQPFLRKKLKSYNRSFVGHLSLYSSTWGFWNRPVSVKHTGIIIWLVISVVQATINTTWESKKVVEKRNRRENLNVCQNEQYYNLIGVLWQTQAYFIYTSTASSKRWEEVDRDLGKISPISRSSHVQGNESSRIWAWSGHALHPRSQNSLNFKSF